MVEAASVALARRHSPPTELQIMDGSHSESAAVAWRLPSERARDAWRDASRATEWAAELLAVLAVEKCRGQLVVSRASRRSRVDYYIRRAGERLEDAVLLEVAGTDDDSLRALLADKLAQPAMNPDRLPALAAVVRFREPRVMIADVSTERA
jgi:hypothetical protein